VAPLRHGRVSLALHRLREGEGTPLLLLHGLRGSSADWQGAAAEWPGPVLALDFSGHGGSGWVRGGAYSPELLVGDADAALAQAGPLAVAGAGLGAWVALLLAGARSEGVRAALLLPGPGLCGGGALPDFDSEVALPPPDPEPLARGWDPAVAVLEEDVRPVDYAAAMAAASQRLLFVEAGSEPPPWWQAARQAPSAELPAADLATALPRLEAFIPSGGCDLVIRLVEVPGCAAVAGAQAGLR